MLIMKPIICTIFFFLSLMSQAQTDSLPIITGTLNDTLFQSEWFANWSQSKGYKPDAETIKALEQVNSNNLTFKVYLGTWCEDSQIHVPAFLVVAAMLNWKYELIGVNREKECPFEKKNCKNWDITKLPTIVVFQDQTEKGRIIETPEISVEKDLLKILK
jgi:thiol-disulfide isomerase/thioredoxin